MTSNGAVNAKNNAPTEQLFIMSPRVWNEILDRSAKQVHPVHYRNLAAAFRKSSARNKKKLLGSIRMRKQLSDNDVQFASLDRCWRLWPNDIHKMVRVFRCLLTIHGPNLLDFALVGQWPTQRGEQAAAKSNSVADLAAPNRPRVSGTFFS